MSIEKIKNLIIEIKDLKRRRYKLKSNNKYKCENYDTYHKEFDEVNKNIFVAVHTLVDECNNFVDYPKEKFLCFDFTKKIKLKHDKDIDWVIRIPFVDKKEYFCLISLFEYMEHDYLFHWRDDTWSFK